MYVYLNVQYKEFIHEPRAGKGIYRNKQNCSDEVMNDIRYTIK